jgi:hypothetical protein
MVAERLGATLEQFNIFFEFSFDHEFVLIALQTNSGGRWLSSSGAGLLEWNASSHRLQ